MKLKTCKNIETILTVICKILMIPFLPFAVVGVIYMVIWDGLHDFLFERVWHISNKMLRNCDEVKDGTIKNERYKMLTSRDAYNWLKDDLNKD